MLYQLGPVKIDVTPFNAHGVTAKAGADHVDKGVIGTAPPTEFVGDGVQTMRFRGSLFPEAIGGMDELEELQGLRAKGTKIPVTRGDGSYLGWYVITSIDEAHRHLGGNGIGARVDVTISMKRSKKPGVFDFFGIIMGLLK